MKSRGRLRILLINLLIAAMNKRLIIILILLGITAVLGALFVYPRSPYPQGALDGFAQCLARKGAVMYGAYWCSHCQNEKAAFGSSFKYVNYVECTEKIAACESANVRGYPTWTFPDGRHFEGEQGLQKLSEESGCPLPVTTSSTKN